MMKILRGAARERVLLRLPMPIRRKFAHPKFPQPTHDFIGKTELESLGNLIMNIAYTEEMALEGVEWDGNIKEPMSWIGLDRREYQIILAMMEAEGWKPGMEEFK
jgi:hypothetical protein